MPSTTVPTPGTSEFATEMRARAVETVSAFAHAHHRVLQELVELSASTAKEGVRLLAELQAAAIETAREQPLPAADPREALEDFQRNPFAWYQKALLTGVEGTQKAFRLLEANAQVVTRSAERLQASAEQTGKHIQEALTSYATRMKDLYGTN